MIFYHGTSLDNWKKIQREGVLWGIRKAPSRCTYLAVDREDVKRYGDIVLQVEYTPKVRDDNYFDGCWQCRVYVPITLKNIEQ